MSSQALQVFSNQTTYSELIREDKLTSWIGGFGTGTGLPEVGKNPSTQIPLRVAPRLVRVFCDTVGGSFNVSLCIIAFYNKNDKGKAAWFRLNSGPVASAEPEMRMDGDFDTMEIFSGTANAGESVVILANITGP